MSESQSDDYPSSSSDNDSVGKTTRGRKLKRSGGIKDEGGGAKVYLSQRPTNRCCRSDPFSYDDATSSSTTKNSDGITSIISTFRGAGHCGIGVGYVGLLNVKCRPFLPWCTL